MTNSSLPALLSALLLGAAGCDSVDTEVTRVELRTVGTMRHALRDGHSEGRADLAELGARGAIGVGALARLGGEVTILEDRVLVASADGDDCRVRQADAGDSATILLYAKVSSWQEHSLPDCASYAELEAAIAEVLVKLKKDPKQPIPVRIRGRAPRIDFHVIRGACPIANPTGPAPWRFAGKVDEVELVGFFVEGAAGRWTHHDRRSHLHAIAGERTGHLDEVSLTGVTLLVPGAR